LSQWLELGNMGLSVQGEQTQAGGMWRWSEPTSCSGYTEKAVRPTSRVQTEHRY